MKNAILIVCTALLLSACGSVAPLRSVDESVNIRVECLDQPGTRQVVLNMLRQAKARDVKETRIASNLEIQASYYVEDNPLWRLEEIAGLLKTQGGVFTVELQDNHHLVKEIR